MSIAVNCEQCGASFRVSDAMGGRRGKCPKCMTVIQVPQAPAPAAAVAKVSQPAVVQQAAVRSAAVVPAIASPPKGPAASAAGTPAAGSDTAARVAAPGSPELYREVLAAFQGSFAAVPQPLLYKLGALLVAVVMVLLPMIYIALIGAVCYAVYCIWPRCLSG